MKRAITKRYLALPAFFTLALIISCSSDKAGPEEPVGPVKVTGITLDEDILELEFGQMELLTATVVPEDAEDKTVEWSSSDPAIATVDRTGRVSGVTDGTAVITAVCNGITAKCTVKVLWDGKFTREVIFTDDAAVITTASQLAWIARQVNEQAGGGAEGFAGMTITLGGDIDLRGKEWSPIGDTGLCPFQGTFDGDGYMIEGLKVEHPTEFDRQAVERTGFFGACTNATIRNLIISGGNITGNRNVGAICGVGVNIEIENCSSSASVTGNWSTGGIVGELNGKSSIIYCHNSGEVYGQEHTGGIVGYANGTGDYQYIQSCYNKGAVTATAGGAFNYRIGGIAGSLEFNAIISACRNDGVISSSFKNFYMGGIVGLCGGYQYSSSVVRSSYNTAAVNGSGPSNVHTAGVVGYADRGTILSGNYNSGTVSGPAEGNNTTGPVYAYFTVNYLVQNCYHTLEGFIDVEGQVMKFAEDAWPDASMPGWGDKPYDMHEYHWDWLRSGWETPLPASYDPDHLPRLAWED